MSYKFDLSQLERDSDQSITAQIVGLVREAIEQGEMAPGAKLPTTRALALDAGVNHLTVVRAYKRLASEGFVTASRGRGTFVRQAPPTVAPADSRWQHAILPRTQRSYVSQVVADTWHAPNLDDHINLANGWTADELLPIADLARMSAGVFSEVGAEALGYGEADGLWELREHLARIGVAAGFAADAEEILVTNGARQAIDLAVRTVIRPGDVVVTESPTFMGTLVSLEESGARVFGVPYDEEGLDVDALEQILARHEVKAVAVQTGSQNPTGQDMSPERVERLLALARERSFFIIEDGVYATIRFGTDEPSRMRALAPDHVIYVDSLSKTLGGGLRLGWIAASGEVRRRIADLKLATDYHTPGLTQHIAARWLAGDVHERHLTRLNDETGRRADAMMHSIEQRLGDEVSVTAPKGGHHVWLTFHRPLDERLLMAEAIHQGMSFTPGGATTVEGDGLAGVRLSFPRFDEERLDEGVRRFAAALRAARRAGSGARLAPVLS
jgi:GntR family transcriptional regulator/MocR family aminotransferase